MKDAGIIGAGGAGFPSYAKLAEGADTLLINGAECEPLLYTDYTILKNELPEVINGALALLRGANIKRAILAIKEHTAKRLSFYDGERLAEGITVKILPNVYPMGDEISLIYQATGRIVQPSRLPISVGVIVYNVETVFNISRAVRLGAPVTEKWLTVGGDIEKPCVLRVPIGMRVRELFMELGISVDENHSVIEGGPSMGKLVDYEGASVGKTTKGLLVLPNNTSAVMSKKTNEKMAAVRAETACCQCTRCTDMCPRALLGYPLEPHKMVRTAMGAVKLSPEMVISATLCCGCGICENIACSQGISPRAVINNYKALVAQNKMRFSSEKVFEPMPEREYRQIPSARWQSTLGVSRFDKCPEYIGAICAKSVELLPNKHIGAPSIFCVKDGDMVNVGDIVANAAGGLSCVYHASICGRVSLGINKITIDKVDQYV